MLTIHFLNVGHGDCTIIRHPSGRLTMIDVNNSQNFDFETYQEELTEEREKLCKERAYQNPLSAAYQPSYLTAGDNRGSILGSLLAEPRLDLATDEARADQAVAKRQRDEITDPIKFLMDNYPGQKVWRYIQTHPDLDHMRGLKNLHEHVGVHNFWDTEHTKPTPNYRSDADKDDWEYYQKLRGGTLGARIHKYTRGDANFAFAKEEDGRPGGDNIEILSPTREIVGACNTADKSNDLSLVLRVHHAGRTVLLPGDAEEWAWSDMASFYGERLKSDFLKASHHGRDSGYNFEALELVAPLVTIVSVGNKPTTDASPKYRYVTKKYVASTRHYGNLTLTIYDDGSWGCSAQWNGSER